MIVGVGIVLAFVMIAVNRTSLRSLLETDACKMKSYNALFLLYLDVEEPSEEKKKREKRKAREMTEGTPYILKETWGSFQTSCYCRAELNS